MDYNNIDLEDGYERDLDIVDPYSFSDLLLEVHCNSKEINEDTIRQQFETSLQMNIDEARNVFNLNLVNITKQAKKERRS